MSDDRVKNGGTVLKNAYYLVRGRRVYTEQDRPGAVTFTVVNDSGNYTGVVDIDLIPELVKVLSAIYELNKEDN